MGHILRVGLIGLVFGIIGTGTGGIMALLINNVGNRFLGSMLQFAAGLMLAVVCFELFPEAFYHSGVGPGITGAVFGVLLVMVIEDIIQRLEIVRVQPGKRAGLLKAGILVAIGIALHNFPEGFAVGAGFEASFKLGATLTFVIAVHDIPEGIAMAIPMKIGGLSGRRTLWLTLLSGVPMGLGAFLGALFGRISPLFISMCLGFAGGAMLYIVIGELIPESRNLYKGRISSAANIAGFLCGLIISVV